MQPYIDRLIRCGYSADRAYSVCSDFVKNLSMEDLEDFVRSVEKSAYENVDRI